ncbi:DUF7313 family protein [Natranaeroarchaeum aerophilus]|uniref:DUF7313 domain-containing protein n=1 Tax=Natranaeroarchaeum aerophilus TaxID=2917711 RepID=A0AAE3FTN4_9EURY|nr:hypothetical protein [Natranaeroarchaeum aerophilus]MCL9814920.1 hypothetical protein [Natranaeroarchaeum aerophilus]
MDPNSLLGPVDLLLPYIEEVLLVLVLVNGLTRLVAQRQYKSQYEEGGAEAIVRHPVHAASNVLLLLGTFYYLTVTFHAGVLLTILVIGLFFTDFFEFEARLAEARREAKIELPKGALAAWGLVFLYVSYRSLFFVVQPIWESIV